MNKRVQIILEQAKELSADDRAELAGQLMASLASETSDFDTDWQQEIASRIDAYDRGETPGESADDVLRQARDRLKR